MEIKIERGDEFRCRLEFTINGIKADYYDFGTTTLNGDERLWECCCKFEPYDTPQESILDKYHISEEEYHIICNKLTDTLEIYSCGCCS